MGLGAQLGVATTRDIATDEAVLAIGGPFLASKDGASKTHSVHTVDRSVPAERHPHSVLDGEIVSALFNDPRATPELRDAVLPIAGALVNSSRGSTREPNLALSDEPVFVEVDGVRYGARLFHATRPIGRGEELLWDYAWSLEARDPLRFDDAAARAQAAPPARRVERNRSRAHRPPRSSRLRLVARRRVAAPRQPAARPVVLARRGADHPRERARARVQGSDAPRHVPLRQRLLSGGYPAGARATARRQAQEV